MMELYSASRHCSGRASGEALSPAATAFGFERVIIETPDVGIDFSFCFVAHQRNSQHKSRCSAWNHPTSGSLGFYTRRIRICLIYNTDEYADIGKTASRSLSTRAWLSRQCVRLQSKRADLRLAREDNEH